MASVFQLLSETPDNWIANTTPVYGDVITFPAVVENFNMDQCTSLTDPNCIYGMRLSVANRAGNPVNLKAGEIQLPTDGIIQFDSDGTFTFDAAPIPTSAVWKDRGDIYRDFQCAGKHV
jgi:hypothetical protein